MKMASRSTDLISKKIKQIARVAHFFLQLANNSSTRVVLCTCCTRFCLSLLLFCTTTPSFLRLKRQTSQLHIVFMDELSYMLTHIFVSCVHVRFYFSLALIYTLSAAPCWPLAFLIFSPPLIIKKKCNLFENIWQFSLTPTLST